MKNLYTVKAIKTFIGMEGHGFNADLYLNNNKIAFVYDDASGGEINFQFNTPEQETDFQKFAVEKLGSEYGDYASAETLINNMVYELLQRRDLKALLNKKTVCHDSNGLFTFKTKFKGNEARMIEHVLTHEKSATLLNNIPFDDAFKLYLEA